MLLSSVLFREQLEIIMHNLELMIFKTASDKKRK
jgi:hypothetical protein